jgi:hypothetical protein
MGNIIISIVHIIAITTWYISSYDDISEKELTIVTGIYIVIILLDVSSTVYYLLRDEIRNQINNQTEELKKLINHDNTRNTKTNT